MSLHYGPKLVTNGLILALDAADANSYPVHNDLKIKDGCIIWLDANDLSTLSITGVEGYVTQWRDKSGNNSHVSQSTGGYYPTYIPNVLNGKSVLRFDGVNDVLTGTIPSGVDNCTMTIVMKVISVSGEDLYFGFGAEVQCNGSRLFYNLAGNNLCFAGWCNDTTSNQSLDVGGTYHIFTIRQNGTSIDFYKDGVYSHSAVGSLLTTTPTVSIGGGPTSRFVNSDIAEAIGYNRVLSDEEIKIIHTYLGRKYGIANIDYPTVWNDLSGKGNNFTMNGTLTYNGTYGFNGFSQTNRFYRNNFPTNLKTSQGGNGYTTIVWGKNNGIGGWNKIIGNGDEQGYIDLYTQSGTGKYVQEDGSLLYYNNGILVDNGTLFVADSTWKMLISTNLNGGNTSNPADAFGIGSEGDGAGNYPWNGNIAIVYIYNRVLTDAEIKQVFNATKSRFNID